MLVVTVCTANLCRSPFAEHVLRAGFRDSGHTVVVRSTGIDVLEGTQPPTPWVGVAAEFGVDLREHRATALGPWLDEADLVLTMTADHLRELVVTRPQLLGRATTIRGAALRAADRAPELVAQQTGRDVLVTTNRDDVDDPVARPAHVQRAVAASLVDLCGVLVAGWPR